MSDSHIQPHRVTKPIQLVAAWLAGLIFIDGMFLGAASSMNGQSWQQGALVVSAIANVPLFLIAIFLLQTRFRAELQEDAYYSEYLSKRTSHVVKIDKESEQEAKLEQLRNQISLLTARVETGTIDLPGEVQHQLKFADWSDWLIAVNQLHPEFEAICAALKEANIPIENVFGTGGDGKPPSRWIVSINRQIPSDLQVQLLRVLSNFQFSGFHRWEPRRDAEEYEDVYIGSYGTEQVVPFSPRLKTLLAKSTAVPAIERLYEATTREG